MQQQKIEYVDFAKGYAIFSIVCYHALQKVALSPMLQKAIVFGGTGVHLFFFLSGLGLSLSAQTAISPVAFYRRRGSKVWLPYVLALSFSLLAAIALDLFPDRWGAWLAGVGLYQMFIEPYIQSFGGHFWFISAIIQFYIVFPLLVWVKNKLNRDALFFALCLGLSIVWWLLVFALGKGEWRSWNSFFLQFLWEFALGMVLATRLRQGQTAGWVAWLPLVPVPAADWKRLLSWLLTGVAGAGLMIALTLKMGAVGHLFNDIPAFLGYTALSAFVYGLGTAFLPFIRRFFLDIGQFSYSLYLIHVLVLDLYLLTLQKAFNIQPGIAGILPYLLVVLPAGRALEGLSRWWVGLFPGLTAAPSGPRK